MRQSLCRKKIIYISGHTLSNHLILQDLFMFRGLIGFFNNASVIFFHTEALLRNDDIEKKSKGHLRTSPLSLASSCVFILVLTTHKGLVIKTFIAPKKYVWNQGSKRDGGTCNMEEIVTFFCQKTLPLAIVTEFRKNLKI